jgi:3-phosphoshikimate 1-carboxyvinyltransferase
MTYSEKISGINGIITVAGDKSISHRALMLGSLAIGKTRITNLLEGADVLHTADAMRAFGATITKENSDYIIHGVGVGGLQEPSQALDFGNAGTGVRLTMGLCATHNMTSIFYGDASLSRRPMARILEPLRLFGAKTTGRHGDKLPLALVGTSDAVPIEYHMPVASAQVKSAILLAALNTHGTTTLYEYVKTRNHTEKMLKHFGANITVTETNQATVIELKGYAELTAQNITVPSDPSSAAFPICAALITPHSNITVQNVLINPTRTGLFDTLIEMGADITYSNQRLESGEMIADITAKSSELKGITVPTERAASMIDEYPILMIVATQATGQTIMRGIGELRVKESDRISAMCKGLKAIGATITEESEGVVIEKSLLKGHATVETFMDHRIAMAFLIAGTISENPIAIDDSRFIQTSFPNFIPLMNKLGCQITDNAINISYDR